MLFCVAVLGPDGSALKVNENKTKGILDKCRTFNERNFGVLLNPNCEVIHHPPLTWAHMLSPISNEVH